MHAHSLTARGEARSLLAIIVVTVLSGCLSNLGPIAPVPLDETNELQFEGIGFSWFAVKVRLPPAGVGETVRLAAAFTGDETALGAGTRLRNTFVESADTGAYYPITMSNTFVNSGTQGTPAYASAAGTTVDATPQATGALDLDAHAVPADAGPPVSRSMLEKEFDAAGEYRQRLGFTPTEALDLWIIMGLSGLGEAPLVELSVSTQHMPFVAWFGTGDDIETVKRRDNAGGIGAGIAAASLGVGAVHQITLGDDSRHPYVAWFRYSHHDVQPARNDAFPWTVESPTGETTEVAGLSEVFLEREPGTWTYRTGAYATYWWDHPIIMALELEPERIEASRPVKAAPTAA